MLNTDLNAPGRPQLKKRVCNQPRINLRPLLFVALGLAFGILVYTRCRFGGFKGTDFVLFALLLACSFRPVSRKRVGAILLCFIVAAGAGAGLMHLKCESYRAGSPAGEYAVTGTIISFTVGDGNSQLILNELTLDGVSKSGRMRVVLPTEELRAGDKISFSAGVTRGALPKNGNSYQESLFIKDIRYFATVDGGSFSVMGRGNALLRLNAAVYNVLHANLNKTQADTAYALLTGNTGSMDDSFTTAVRQGGVAHIFAVSGLHIGILYTVVALLFRRLGKFQPLPAVAAVIVYAAFCGFSVSSVRAVIMCSVLGVYGAIGRKYDFTSAIAFAASLVLLIRPAEWLSAGFRLSFGACIGLSLYARTFRRAFKKLPRFLCDYLGANLSVQIFTLPVMLDTFGYLSLWGTVLNTLLVPVLPVLFLGLFISVILALIIPPAAGVALAVPNGMLTLFLYIFSFDFSLVLTGFSLGAGGAVWTAGAVALSERVRLTKKIRTACALVFCLLFSSMLVLENAVFKGCKVIAIGGAILVETRTEHVLIIDGSLASQSYQNFLNRHFSGTLDAVIVVDSNAGAGLSDALYLPTGEVRVSRMSDTGFWETTVLYDREFSYGNLKFRFEGNEKLTLTVESSTVEIDFTGIEALRADLFLSGESAGVYYLRAGKIYRTG